MATKSIRYLISITAFALISLAVAAYALTPQDKINDKQSFQNKNQDITLEIIRKLDRKHFLSLDVDNALSSKFLDNYLDKLDSNKAFFYQSDIDEINQYRDRLDDQLKDGDNTAGFVIYQRFKQRLSERLEKVIDLLQNDSVTFDFSKDESIEDNAENKVWLTSAKEGDEYWRKRIKSFLLSQKISGESPDKARKQLIKRYENQLVRISKNSDDDVYEIYINAFAELYDPHTSYLAPRTAENFIINMSLSLEGIGAVLQTEDEHTKVVRLVTGGPAHKQGQLQAADRITGVAQGDEGDVVDVIGWRLDEVVSLIRGPKDSIVRLQVNPSDAAQKGLKEIRIKRDKVKLEDQAAQKAILTLPGENGSEFKVGVINIPTFYVDFEAYNNRDPNYRSTTKDVLRLLGELEAEGIDGLLLDLRNNGGGSLREATSLTDLFIGKGPVVQIGNGTRNNAEFSRSEPYYRGPLVVMINRLSASASEIFAGAIQDYQRGLIVGSQSFGKGTVQSLTPLDSKGDIKITESKFYRVSGDSTQHRGVIPDISFPELLDDKEIGESSYETALAWSKTRPVKYSQYLPIPQLLAPLEESHSSRILNDPDFLYLTEQKNLFDQFGSRTLISLNEKVRLKEKNGFEQATLTLENNRRKSKGLKVFVNYEKFKESNDEKNTQRAAKAGTTVIDTEEDAMLKEAGYILKDFSGLLSEAYKSKVADSGANPTTFR
jgi:carboxyl-terminal processing protease